MTDLKTIVALTTALPLLVSAPAFAQSADKPSAGSSQGANKGLSEGGLGNGSNTTPSGEGQAKGKATSEPPPAAAKDGAGAPH